MNDSVWPYLIGTLLISYFLRKIFIRLRLSFAKHPSLRGHSKMSRRVAKLLKNFEYDKEKFFSSDLAPQEIIDKRKLGLSALVEKVRQQSSLTCEFSDSLSQSISDMQFTSAHKVPFPYRSVLAKELKLGTICQQSKNVEIQDMDGNWHYDLSGSYGVNVFGYDFYKACLNDALESVKNMGPVLGPYHPLIRDNVERIKKISNKEEVSFHMSGTEAVMQAVRLARYHTGRSHLVRFCGSYHGWWDGVQVGIGNQRKTDDVYTLSDMSQASLKVLETRNDIACIIINPMQALHPNQDAPGDATLIASTRNSDLNRQAYGDWLKKLRQVCSRRNIVLIFDEVFTGFRLAKCGAQEYFNVKADLVTYGKTLGGGLPIGVVAGSHKLMKRFKSKTPANVSFARGTFNSHPLVMATMDQFLTRIESPAIDSIYDQADSLWSTRVNLLNKKLQDIDLPIRLVNMHSVLSVQYTLPSRYNWMFQFYLKAQDLELSWTGTGRFIMSLAYTDDDFAQVTERIVTAAKNMKNDGWWWQSPELTNKAIKRMMVLDILKARFPFLNTLLTPPAYEDQVEVSQRGHSS